MTSYIDSTKLILGDSNAMLKISTLSLIPFAIYNILEKQTDVSNILVSIVLGLIFYGYLIKTLNTSLDENTNILPPINAFTSLWTGIRGVFSSGIFLLPIILTYNKMNEMISFPLQLDDSSRLNTGIVYFVIIALLIAIYSTVSSFLFCSIIFYSKNCKILEGLNLRKILKNCHELIVYIAFSVIIIPILNLPTSLPVCAGVYWLFGNGQLLEYALSFFLTLNLLSLFQNLSQVYYEQIKE